MLQVQDNPARSVKDLSGIWRFNVRSTGTWSFAFFSLFLTLPPIQEDKHNVGVTERWWLKPLAAPLLHMPVPASYNDITQGAHTTT